MIKFENWSKYNYIIIENHDKFEMPFFFFLIGKNDYN